MKTERFIIDSATEFQGHTISATYLDPEGVERVMYSDGLTLAEYLDCRPDSYVVIDENRLQDLMAGYWASMVTEASEITEEEYREHLNELPPENWCSSPFEHFRMCEYWSGPLTQQYACCDGIYLTKRINVLDRSTWISEADFGGKRPIVPRDQLVHGRRYFLGVSTGRWNEEHGVFELGNCFVRWDDTMRPRPVLANCDSCGDNMDVNCHDCEQYQQARGLAGYSVEVQL